MWGGGEKQKNWFSTHTLSKKKKKKKDSLFERFRGDSAIFLKIFSASFFHSKPEDMPECMLLVGKVMKLLWKSSYSSLESTLLVTIY